MRISWLLSACALILCVLLGAAGGAGQPADVAIILWWKAWRASAPEAVRAVIAFTQLGGASALIPLALLGALAVWRTSGARLGLWFLGSTIGGRLVIEGLKLAVARPRPDLDAHPVLVHSTSFPSAHAGNSMIVYLSLALFLTPARWRGLAAAAAIGLALAIGWTRPMLGVHWPSDVVAGWLFGGAWALAAWRLRPARGERVVAVV